MLGRGPKAAGTWGGAGADGATPLLRRGPEAAGLMTGILQLILLRFERARKKSEARLLTRGRLEGGIAKALRANPIAFGSTGEENRVVAQLSGCPSQGT